MNHQMLRRVRQFHRYIGVFFAPAILFFAISGGLQTFRLQQASGWSGASPPTWMAWMGSVHIDQSGPRDDKKPDANKPKPPVDPAKAAERAARQQAALPMKIFTVALAVALALSTLLGVVIAVSLRATRRVAIAMLVAGSIVPILLIR